jgi:hypothetical protein
LEYLDDPNSHQEIAEHLEKCSYCREKAEALAHFQDRMGALLYRSACPSPVELGEYHLHLLRASQMLLIGQHLRECPYCTKEIADLNNYLSELSQPSLLESVKVFIAELMSGTPTTPAFGAVRGDAKQPERYQADDIPIIIAVDEDKDHPGFRTVLGLIPGISLRGFTIEMYQAENLIASTLVDEIGNFLFTQLVPGLYDLVLPGLDAQIRIPSVIV